jgi:uncharacterized protein YndB with AHSA1/START domain
MTRNVPAGIRLLGSLGTAEGKGVVRMEDHFDTTVDDVWSALTDRDRLAVWYGTVEGQMTLGGEYRAHLHASGWQGTGRIEAFDAPRHMRVVTTMDSDEPNDGVFEVTLGPDGDGTQVVWEERGMPEDLLAAYGAGIQVHVEDLGAYLAGRDRCDAEARFAELFPAYRQLAAADE